MAKPSTAHSETAPNQSAAGRAVSPRPPPVVVAAVPAASALADPAPGTGATPPVPEPPKFVLQGIISAATWREATINGYAVREGDEVDGAKVIAIESRRVKLQLGDREILLRMP